MYWIKHAVYILQSNCNTTSAKKPGYVNTKTVPERRFLQMAESSYLFSVVDYLSIQTLQTYNKTWVWMDYTINYTMNWL